MSGTFKKLNRKRGHRLGGRKKGFGAAGPRHLGIPKALPRAPGVEHKFYDTFVSALAVSSNSGAADGEADPATVLTISAPSQGDGPNQRDGKLITVDTVLIEGIVSTPIRTLDTEANDGVPFSTVYIALVQDTQTNGAQMASELAFYNRSGTTLLAASPLKNLLYAKRFNTLKVWAMDLPTPSSVINEFAANISTPGTNTRFSCFLKMKMPVNFNGEVSAGVASVVDNSLHMICWTNVASAFVSLSYHARIRYVG